MLNSTLVAEGLATVLHYEPNDARLNQLQQVERTAKDGELGLHSKDIACTEPAQEEARQVEEAAARAAEEAAAEAKRQVEQEAREAAERAAQEAEEAAQRAAREAEQAAEQAARDAKEAAERASRQAEESASDESDGGDYDGYTGPRCYAPGGKTWKPCP